MDISPDDDIIVDLPMDAIDNIQYIHPDMMAQGIAVSIGIFLAGYVIGKVIGFLFRKI